jgi:hypothetical protein
VELASDALIPLDVKAWARHKVSTKTCECGATKCRSAYISARSRIEIAIAVFGRFKAALLLMCECAHMFVCEDVTVQRKVAADLMFVLSKKLSI